MILLRNEQLMITVFVLIVSYRYVWSKPYDTNILNNRSNNGRCERNIDVDTNCQKCAKITKSDIVYPMCCTDKEDVYRWCYKYLNFGLQKRNAETHRFSHSKHVFIEDHPNTITIY